MPDLDHVLEPPQSQPATREVLEGELVDRGGGELYARIDDRSALWGPLVDGTNGTAVAGMSALICVAQSGRPWIVAVEGWAIDDVPHLALPLRVLTTGYVSVQQDTLDEVRTNVAAIVAFPVDSRIEAPDFGVPELELAQRPLDVDTLASAIGDFEPRAAINVVELPYDARDPLAAHVRIEVAFPGETEEVV